MLLVFLRRRSERKRNGHSDREFRNARRELAIINLVPRTKLDQRQTAQAARSGGIARPIGVVETDFELAKCAGHALRVVAMRKAKRVTDRSLYAHLSGFLNALAFNKASINGTQNFLGYFAGNLARHLVLP